MLLEGLEKIPDFVKSIRVCVKSVSLKIQMKIQIYNAITRLTKTAESVIMGYGALLVNGT